MIHLRYDWRRRVLWASVCLIIFLNSSTAFTGKPGPSKKNVISNEIKAAGGIENMVAKETFSLNKLPEYFFRSK